MDKEFVNEVNKIIFDFIWKGKDKVNRCVLVGDIEDGGLKALHLGSILLLKLKEYYAVRSSRVETFTVAHKGQRFYLKM